MLSSVIEELLPFDCINFNDSNGWNFMKLILSIYDYDVVMHLEFCQAVISYRGVVVL